VTSQATTTLLLIVAIATMSPFLSDLAKRWMRLPGVVIEIALGIIIGPQVLGWAHLDEVLKTGQGVEIHRSLAGPDWNLYQRAMAEGEYELAAQRLIYARDAEPRNIAIVGELGWNRGFRWLGDQHIERQARQWS